MRKLRNVLVMSFLGLTLVSCGSLTRPRHRIELDKQTVKAISSLRAPIRQTRSQKYFGCVKELNREGIKQALIKSLCDSSFGAID